MKRRGLINEEDHHRPALKRFERSQPNELLQMDFKGELALASGGECFPLSVLDDHSRYGMSLEALPSQHGSRVQACLEACFERYGIPEAMLMDHGTPWWSSTNGHGLTQLSVFLIKQGIALLLSGVNHPQTQGKVERFHRTLASWLRFHGMPKTLEGFRSAFQDFLAEYNQVRPHEALGLVPPAHRYRSSERTYQPCPAEWEYPEGADVRTLSASGNLYLGQYYFVCHALAHERVMLDHFADRVLITYRHMLIREIDRSTGRTHTILKPYGPTGHPS
jgi:transposase InsO family protein